MCLPIVAGVISGVGAAMGAAGQQAQAKGQQAMDERQAAIERTTGAYKADRTQDDVNRTLGQERAGFAANGVGLSGSAADTISDSTEEGALDVAAIRWNSKLAGDNLMYKAKLDNMNAKQAGMAIPFAFAAPVINGIGTYKSSFA
jgi:hypothetical protein